MSGRAVGADSMKKGVRKKILKRVKAALADLP